jgi:hypothetical protein
MSLVVVRLSETDASFSGFIACCCGVSDFFDRSYKRKAVRELGDLGQQVPASIIAS